MLLAFLRSGKRLDVSALFQEIYDLHRCLSRRKEQAATGSVNMRLISSGMLLLKLRNPASTCAIGMFILRQQAPPP